MPLCKTSVIMKPKQSPIWVSAKITSKTIKCTKPLDLIEPIILIDCSPNIVIHKSPLFNRSSKPFVKMSSSNMWDEKSIETKIENFQQNLELVDIMDKIFEKHKERDILALAQQGVKLLSDFDVTDLKQDKEESPLDTVTQKLQDLQLEMERMKRGKIQPTEFSLKKVCPLQFDKKMTFTPFPQNV